MVCQDGFVTSHAVTDMMILQDEDVKGFIGTRSLEGFLLDVNNPVSMGLIDLQPYYIEHKRQQAEAMKKAKAVILDVAKEYEALSGRSYDLFESYKMDDAEVAIVIINSTAGTAKAAIDMLRQDGVKAGLVKVRVYRPFPAEELKEALKNTKAIAVLDRADSFNTVGGPLYVDIRSALFGSEVNVPVINFIYGLGGRDTDVNDIKKVYNTLTDIVATGNVPEPYQYLGVRE